MISCSAGRRLKKLRLNRDDPGIRDATTSIEMKVHAIDHVQLAMPAGGEDRARDFYVGVLGLSEVAKPLSLAVRGGVWFEQGALKIHLGVDHDFRPARKAHPGLLVIGLGELVDRCRGAGYDINWDESAMTPRRVFVSDPFGNRIELIELGD